MIWVRVSRTSGRILVESNRYEVDGMYRRRAMLWRGSLPAFCLHDLLPIVQAKGADVDTGDVWAFARSLPGFRTLQAPVWVNE